MTQLPVFFAVAQSELGSYKNAYKTAKELAYLTLSSEVPNQAAEQILLYEGIILPALVAIRYRQWEDTEDEIHYWHHFFISKER